jgi:hypothetical protein
MDSKERLEEYVGEGGSRRSWFCLVRAAAGLALVCVLVAATLTSPHVALTASTSALAERAGTARLRSTRLLWDEDAVGKEMEAEINSVKKQFMQEQMKVGQALQLTNASEDTNTTAANATSTSDSNPIAAIPFDNEWFARWCDTESNI